MKTKNQYNYLAQLFRYPLEGYRSNAMDCFRYLKSNYPEAAQTLTPFIDYISAHSDYEIEELFGKTFHIQAVCYLDIGYVLFAEDYKRGEFLVQMKKEQENADLDCGEELADNLPNVLKLMAVMKDEDFLEEFAVRIMVPALRKMSREFEEARMELKDKVRRKKQKVVIMEDVANKNIYHHAIDSLLTVVLADFPSIKYNDPEIIPTLGGNLGTVLSGGCGPTCATPTQQAIVTQNER